MKRSLRWVLVAFVIVVVAFAVGIFPATAFAESSDYSPPYPSSYGSSYGCSYMVRFGDTMSSVAGRYGTSVWSLMQMNGMQNPNLIYAGTAMRVPCAPGGYRYVSPYAYPGMNPYRGGYPHSGMNPYRGMYSYPNPYSSQCMGIVYTLPCSGGYMYHPYPTQPYPSQPYPSQSYPPQPYPGSGYPAPVYPTPAPRSTPPATGQVMVVMRNIAFNPATLTIHVGQTVVWRNDDVAPHTTTSGTCSGGVCTPLMGWDSGTLNPGQSFSHQFTTAGTFSYYCRIHGAMMQGTIMVMP